MGALGDADGRSRVNTDVGLRAGWSNFGRCVRSFTLREPVLMLRRGSKGDAPGDDNGDEDRVESRGESTRGTDSEAINCGLEVERCWFFFDACA